MKNQFKIPVLREITIKYHRKMKQSSKISKSEDASSVARQIYKLSGSNIELKEYFFVMFLDRANNILGYLKLSEGGISSTTVDNKLLFSTALKSLASGIILVHNHPTGNKYPSETDKQMTKKIKEQASIFDILVLDHIILTCSEYYSFADEGLV